MSAIQNVLKRSVPGIQSQRLRKNSRRPIIQAKASPVASQGVRAGNPECPVSDTYADGVPGEAK